MSNKTFNARNNNSKKAKKGISPVIATVILVAVAVVIAAALAGFSSSLFGTYSSAGGAVTVQSISVRADGTSDVTLNNSGNTNDEMLSIQAVPNPVVTPQADNTGTGTEVTSVIEPGTSQIYHATLGDNTSGNPFEAGQTLTVKMTFKSGLVLTQSVVVTA
jgi:flagellin-like protein